MPFAKMNLWYPYPMFLLNWLFAVLALATMWYKAPFNNFIKFCITFSAPFLSLYSISARCYSVGIFFMFLAMAIYKDRLKHPYWYLLWLVLAANTSLPLCIASGVLGCILVFDLIKNKCDKKILYVIFSTLFLNLILFYFQFSGATVPDYDTNVAKSFYIMAFLGLEHIEPSVFLYKLILLRIGIFIFLAFLYRSKRAFIFFLVTALTVFLFFTFVYNARVHHLCLIYIFAIMAFWMYSVECKNIFKRDWFSIFFIAVLLELVFMQAKPTNGFKGIAECILEDNLLKTAKLYTNVVPIALTPSIPYLEQEGIYLYDLSGVNLSSYEGLKRYFSADAKKFNPDILAENLDMNKNNYLLSVYSLPENYINGHKFQIRVKAYKRVYFRNRNAYLFIYKIIDVNNEPTGNVFVEPEEGTPIEQSEEQNNINIEDLKTSGYMININRYGVRAENIE